MNLDNEKERRVAQFEKQTLINGMKYEQDIGAKNQYIETLENKVVKMDVESYEE